jgi:hypothetical protein
MRLSTAFFLLAAALAAACITSDYQGKAYEPTVRMDVYYSAEEVPEPYWIMGEMQADVMGGVVFRDVEKKMVREALARGADGLLLAEARPEEVVISSAGTGGDIDSRYVVGAEGNLRKKGTHDFWSSATYRSGLNETVVRAQLIKYMR